MSAPKSAKPEAKPEKKKKRERKPRTYIILKKTGDKTYEYVGEFTGIRNMRHLVRKVRIGEIKLDPGEYVVISKRAFAKLPSVAFEPPRRRGRTE